MSRLMLALAREDLTGRTRDHAEQLTPLALAAVARRDDPDSVLAGLSMLAHLGDDRVGGLITELSASSEKPTRKMAHVAQRWSFEGLGSRSQAPPIPPPTCAAGQSSAGAVSGRAGASPRSLRSFDRGQRPRLYTRDRGLR